MIQINIYNYEKNRICEALFERIEQIKNRIKKIKNLKTFKEQSKETCLRDGYDSYLKEIGLLEYEYNEITNLCKKLRSESI